MSTDVNDAQKLPPVEDSRATMASPMNNDPSANRNSTELLFEAPRTPHDRSISLENVQDVEGDHLSGEEWVLHEPEQVKRAATSVDDNTNPTSSSASQAMSNSPPIVLKSLPSTPNPVTNGHWTYSTQDDDDDEDASKLLISSLRTQLTDLHSQLEMLNSKLISSYSRISSLEDDLYLSNSNLDTTQARLKSLEQQRQSHIEALQSGVLVERAAIATELSKLMERATEEERKRGEEEGKRKEIETELFELSAGLFGQANTMVAEERIARASAQRRVEECEAQIFAQSKQVKELEGTVRVLNEERNGFEREVGELHGVIKAVGRHRRGDRGVRIGRVPYKEYIAFVEHLRALVPSSPTPPAISTLITLPFLARLVTEDSEPTLRLDTAPSLNWLSRRSVLSAIHHAQLTLEDLHIATIFLEANALSSTSSSSPANSMLEMQMGRVKKVSCALCGKVVWALPTEEDIPADHEGGDKWNAPKFLKNVVAAGSSTSVGVGVSTSPARFNKRAMVRPLSPPPPTSLQTVIPAFRIITSSSSAASYASSFHTPAASGTPTTPQHQQRSAPYPLCVNGWCQERLRTTIELWKFLREGVVERIWEDETRSEMIIAHQLQRENLDAPVPPLEVNVNTAAESMPTPLVPPRKKLAGLWGVISGSVSPADGTSPTASLDTPSSAGMVTRGINIGGLTSGLGGFLGRKNSTPNVKLSSSSTPHGPPVPPPRDVRSASLVLDTGVSKVQDTEKTEEKAKETRDGPVEEEKTNAEKVEQIVQGEEEGPPLDEKTKEAKSGSPLVGSTPLTHSPSDRTDVHSPEDFTTPSESVAIPPHAKTLVEKLDVVKAEFEMEALAENPKPVQARATEAVECPQTPEPKTVTNLDTSEPVPEALAPSGSPGATPTPATPARNPARVVPFGGTDPTKADTSRPVTPGATIGAPPPVPRRAAARGAPRPGSMLVTPDVLKSLPPKSERRAIGKVGGEGGEKKDKEKQAGIANEKEGARVEVEAEEEPKVVTEKTEGVVGVVSVTTEGTKEDVAEASAPDPVSQESLAVPAVAAKTATSITPVISPSLLPEYALESATEALPTTTATETPPTDQASIISASSASVYTKYTKGVLPSIPATTTTVEDLPENDEWVGNARWEDRAWNEIVRIREEMFWARLGGGTVGGAEVD